MNSTLTRRLQTLPQADEHLSEVDEIGLCKITCAITCSVSGPIDTV